jgi:hypothetical protein
MSMSMSISTSRSWRRLANINAACLGACPSIRFAGEVSSLVSLTRHLRDLNRGIQRARATQ